MRYGNALDAISISGKASTKTAMTYAAARVRRNDSKTGGTVRTIVRGLEPDRREKYATRRANAPPSCSLLSVKLPTEVLERVGSVTCGLDKLSYGRQDADRPILPPSR